MAEPFMCSPGKNSADPEACATAKGGDYSKRQVSITRIEHSVRVASICELVEPVKIRRPLVSKNVCPRCHLRLLHHPAMAPASYSSDDKEKGFISDVEVDHAAPDDSAIADRYARYGKLGPVIQRIFASGVEARGVERVPESERETKNMWNKYVRVCSCSCMRD